MDATETNDEKQPRKRSAFTVMNNIRDLCDQSDARKLLLFTLATYCDGDGICYPSNETLATVTRKSTRTGQRMLKGLVADGDLETLASGIGRDQRRVLHLKRYAARKGDKAVSPLNVTGSLGKTSCNSHREHPVTAKEGEGVLSHKSSETRHPFSQRIRYPDSKDEMIEMLEELGIEYNPDYDGNFFEQMQASDWTIRGEPIWDWPAVYKARLEVTFPGNGI